MSSALLNRIAAEHAAAVSALPELKRAQGPRRRALQQLLSQGLPGSRDENWRYAGLRALERLSFTPAAAVALAAAPGQAALPAIQQLPACIPGYARYVFVDGFFAPGLSASPAASPGVRVLSLAAAGPAAAADAGPAAAPPAAPAPAPAADAGVATGLVGAGATASGELARHSGDTAEHDAAFALLNEAFAADGASITIEAGAAPACIEIVFLSSGRPVAAYPRLQVRVAANARLSLIERHLGSGEAEALVNAAARISVEQDAVLDHYRLQQSGAGTTWMDTLSVTVAGNAGYTVHTVHLGALAARSTSHVRLAGEQARLSLNAVSLADRRQVHDSMALVEHAAAGTRTEESFRGIAGGRSRIAFNGKIIVHAAAVRADSQQSLRGLIAGGEAEIDLRPQLEIYTDEVRCSHGATTGKLDETMLFYLLSRGIEPQTAQRLLKWAFITDVVAKIAIPELRRYVQQGLATQLQDHALEELL